MEFTQGVFTLPGHYQELLFLLLLFSASTTSLSASTPSTFPSEAFQCIEHNMIYTPGLFMYEHSQHLVNCHYEKVIPAADIVVKSPTGVILTSVNKSEAIFRSSQYSLTLRHIPLIYGNTVLSVEAVAENINWKIDLPIYYTGGNAGVTVYVYTNTTSSGSDHTMVCRFHASNRIGEVDYVPEDAIEFSRLEWHEKDGFFGYKIYEYDVANGIDSSVTPPYRYSYEMQRYSRDGYNLVISNFKGSDSREKCCSIGVKDKRTMDYYSATSCSSGPIIYTSPKDSSDGSSDIAEVGYYDKNAKQMNTLSKATIGLWVFVGNMTILVVVMAVIYRKKKNELSQKLIKNESEMTVTTAVN